MENNNEFAHEGLFLIDYIPNKVMTDLELFAHFYRYIEYMLGDVCYVDKENYRAFVEKLPIKDSKTGFAAKIGYLGCIYFNIDDVAHFFKDFPLFKKIFKEQLKFNNKA